MARVLVVSADDTVIVVVSTDDEGWTSGRCSECHALITDRGHFEDTVQAAVVHVDQH
jgi:hypothetical protein